MWLKFVLNLLPCFFLLLSCFSANSVGAEPKKLNRQQAASLVQQKYPGRVLKIKESSRNYRVRVLQKKGRVLDVNVDRKSGRMNTVSSSRKDRKD